MSWKTTPCDPPFPHINPCLSHYSSDPGNCPFLLDLILTSIYAGTKVDKRTTAMAIRLPRIVSVKKVPKGYFAVYVGEDQKRFVIPVSFLNQPLFQDLLGLSEEEFGYTHPTGGLRIPCNEDIFLEVTSCLI